MSDLKELQMIKEIFNNFKNLEAQHLVNDENIYARKIDEIVEELDDKMELIGILDELIEVLEAQLAEKDAIEVLDVEIIRRKRQAKKIEKQIRKLESLNSSRIKVDVNERDKIRLRKNIIKLFMLNRLLEISINKDGKVVIADGEGSFKVFQLNSNNSKDVNTAIIWENVKQCSPHAKEWAALFAKKE